MPIAIIWLRREHFLKYKVAGLAAVLLTTVAILHFDAGMLATDPYDDFLDEIGAPGPTWRASILILLGLSYLGDVQEYFARVRTVPRHE